MGVTGGIAAYNAAEFVRLLIKAGANVHVVMTKNAQEFIKPLTFQTFSGNPVTTDLFSLIEDEKIGHIAMADLAQLIIILPATANIIGKTANGVVDDFLSTMVIASRASILFFPSMNVNMRENKILRKNIETFLGGGLPFYRTSRKGTGLSLVWEWKVTGIDRSHGEGRGSTRSKGSERREDPDYFRSNP